MSEQIDNGTIRFLDIHGKWRPTPKGGIYVSECNECGMGTFPAEYHPWAACELFKAHHNGTHARAILYTVIEFGCALVAPNPQPPIELVMDTIDTRWRPIRTAPRDGRVVEVISSGCTRFMLLRYANNQWQERREATGTWYKGYAGMYLAWRKAHPDWQATPAEAEDSAAEEK